MREAFVQGRGHRPGEPGSGLGPLVATKLRPSQASARLVARPRLVDRMLPDAARRLTLVSAPAGSGKTTLLRSFAERRQGDGRRVAWLALDPADNDVRRFVSYLVSALRAAAGDEAVGHDLLDALQAAELPPVEALARALAGEASHLADLDVVLDDYQAIDDPGVHQVVTALLDHAAHGVHLVIASRTDPPLPLARLRAAGQLERLGAADLAFTLAEATAYLRAMDLDLARQDVTTLEGRTEGWVAGLQLAALSMRGRPDPTAFVESFSGVHRDVLDYLGDEVLRVLPADVQQFLLATSILDQLTGPLCDAVTGSPGGSRVLEALERDNVFVVALDDERRWYRYHHLFAEFLRSRLHRDQPGRSGDLHRRAAAWYDAEGHPDEAVRHAVAAADFGLATRVIAAESGPAWSRGEVPTVLRWLEALPAPVKDQRPRLWLQQAMAMALTGRPAAADQLAATVRPVSDDPAEHRSVTGFASAIRSWCARLRGDAPVAIGLAREALALLPDEEGGLRAFAGDCLGDALWTTGDLAGAADALLAAAATGRAAGHVYATLSALTLLVRVQLERGRLRDAGETLRRARQFLADHGVEHLPAAAALHLGTGVLLYEADDLAGAERELSEGLHRAELTGNVTDLTWGRIALSRLRHARGEEPAALELAETALQVARRYGADLETTLAAGWLTRLRSTTDARRRPTLPEGDTRASAAAPARLVERVTTARALQGRGRHREALRALEEARRIAVDGGRGRDLIEITTLQALARWASSRPDDGLAAVREAMALAEPEGYLRIFVDEGPPVAALVAALARTTARGTDEAPAPGPSADYVERVADALDRQRRADAVAARLVSPLTEREAEILALVAAGKSNRAIAAELVVTVGTVKTHVNHLFRKLDVHSRTQAVARAAELRLPGPATR